MNGKFIILVSCLFVSSCGREEDRNREVEIIPKGIFPGPLPVLPAFPGGAAPGSGLGNFPPGAFPQVLPALTRGDTLPCSFVPFPMINEPACAAFCMLKFKIQGGYCKNGICVCRG